MLSGIKLLVKSQPGSTHTKSLAFIEGKDHNNIEMNFDQMVISTCTEKIEQGLILLFIRKMEQLKDCSWRSYKNRENYEYYILYNVYV